MGIGRGSLEGTGALGLLVSVRLWRGSWAREQQWARSDCKVVDGAAACADAGRGGCAEDAQYWARDHGRVFQVTRLLNLHSPLDTYRFRRVNRVKKNTVGEPERETILSRKEKIEFELDSGESIEPLS